VLPISQEGQLICQTELRLASHGCPPEEIFFITRDRLDKNRSLPTLTHAARAGRGPASFDGSEVRGGLISDARVAASQEEAFRSCRAIRRRASEKKSSKHLDAGGS
jgi:hypothetical protein